ncbi:hypothetical protein BCJMU51_p1248 (plasmid) [Bacillus cereus]|jgi:hypothetical protein|nr:MULTISPECIES: hypothetical protein [Bacillus]MDV8115187.1 hypothetical protein [Bacillus sp. BAU-SS-2023]MCU5360353.1 hypothetical protein [Bacillus pacificus]MCU5398668.1 hypothetical protein [Bacillus pacificus]MCX2467075.1 hypothetical protein [Bacillus sp. AM01]WEI96571.1 hypothetical protein PZ893_28210 [Bacillus cereus]
MSLLNDFCTRTAYTIPAEDGLLEELREIKKMSNEQLKAALEIK